MRRRLGELKYDGKEWMVVLEDTKMGVRSRTRMARNNATVRPDSLFNGERTSKKPKGTYDANSIFYSKKF